MGSPLKDCFDSSRDNLWKRRFLVDSRRATETLLPDMLVTPTDGGSHALVVIVACRLDGQVLLVSRGTKSCHASVKGRGQGECSWSLDRFRVVWWSCERLRSTTWLTLRALRLFFKLSWPFKILVQAAKIQRWEPIFQLGLQLFLHPQLNSSLLNLTLHHRQFFLLLLYFCFKPSHLGLLMFLNSLLLIFLPAQALGQGLQLCWGIFEHVQDVGRGLAVQGHHGAGALAHCTVIGLRPSRETGATDHFATRGDVEGGRGELQMGTKSFANAAMNPQAWWFWHAGHVIIAS